MDLSLSQAETRFLLITLLSVVVLAQAALLMFMAYSRVRVRYAGVLLASIIYSGIWTITVLVSILWPTEFMFGLRAHFGVGIAGFLYLFVAHFPCRRRISWRILALAMPAFFVAALFILPDAAVSKLEIVGYGYQREWNGWWYPIGRFFVLIYFIMAVITMLFQSKKCASPALKLIWKQLFISTVSILSLNMLFSVFLPMLGFGISTQLAPFSLLGFLMVVATIIKVYPELEKHFAKGAT